MDNKRRIIIYDKEIEIIAEAVKRYYKRVKEIKEVKIKDNILEENTKDKEYLLLTFSSVLGKDNDYEKSLLNYFKKKENVKKIIIEYNNKNKSISEIKEEKIKNETQDYTPYRQNIGHLGGDDVTTE